jgi:ankyrin repeat protein
MKLKVLCFVNKNDAKVHLLLAGRHAGTPLHHAVKRGLEQTVKLLLSSGGESESYVVERHKFVSTALRVCFQFYGFWFFLQYFSECFSEK